MKKFLSLVLALVMTMSLVTISSGAKEFTDDNVITYDEAIAVISEIGVVSGYEDGSFSPTANLTRQAAAKIICNLILGPTTAEALKADSAPFPDVPLSSEFAGYIAYCSQNGIINGYPDGTFKPGNSLTGYAFMKMLLGALGYDGAIEGYTGDNWSVNVAKRAIGIGLQNGLTEEFNGTKTVNREEACLYAFNTLQADLVEYDTRINVNVNGETMTVGASTPKSMTWNSSATRRNNIKEDDYVQFAEEYFTKLEKRRGTDEFERPGYTWLYDKEEIGTYVDWSLQVGEDYLDEVTGRDLYDLLTVTYLREFPLTYYANGLVPGTNNPTANDADATTDGGKNIVVSKDISRANEKKVGITGRGVLTQVFMDKDHGEITVTSISTWLAKGTSDYNEKREDANLDVYSKYHGNTIPKVVDPEDCSAAEDVTEGTFYLVNISYKNNPGTAASNGDIVAISEPEILEESVITKYSATNTGDKDYTTNKVTKLTTGGTEYKANANLLYDEEILDKYDTDLLTSNTYNVYLDQYGNFIGVDLFEGEKNYVFITGFDRPTSNLSISTADAAGIFLDGTMSKVKVNVTDTNKNIRKVNTALGGDSTAFGNQYFWEWDAHLQVTSSDDGMYALNRWFTYTVDNDGTYTLKPADKMAIHSYYGVAGEVTIKTDNLYIDDNVRINGDKAYKDLHGDGGSNAITHTYYDSAEDAIGGWVNRVRTYGNDDSVYLTIDTDIVDTRRMDSRAITEVTGIYTGVQSSTINIHTGTDAHLEEAQAYVVYDKNNYIIGAVIDGEGDGGAATVAFVTSGPKSERYEDGVYYWEFEAVVDGSVQTLTAKSSSRTDLDDLRHEAEASYESIGAFIAGRTAVAPTFNQSRDWNQYDGLVELRFDNNDFVTSIKTIGEKDIYSYFGNATKVGLNQFDGASSIVVSGQTPYTDTAYTNLDLSKAKAYRIGVLDKNDSNHLGIINNTWSDGVNTNHYDSSPNGLKLVGRTLYVTKNQTDEGLALAADAKAVVIQWENGDWETTEYSAVKTAVNSVQLNADGVTFDGEVIAALNSNGTAAWVVIISYNKIERTSSPIVNQRLTDVRATGFHSYYEGNYSLQLGWYENSPYTLTYELVGAEAGTTYHVELQISDFGSEWRTWDSWDVIAGTGEVTLNTPNGPETLKNVYTKSGIGTPSYFANYRLVVGEYGSAVAVLR